MIDRIFKGLAGGPPAAGDASRGVGLSQTGWTTIGSLPMVASRGVERWATYRAIYLTVPWVYASVNKLARSLGRLPIHTYQLDSRARKKRVRFDVATPGRESAGQRLDRLMQRPDGRTSKNAFNKATLIERLTYGNALWVVDEVSHGLPSRFYRVRWRDMLQVAPDSVGRPQAYVYRPWNGISYGKTTTRDPSEVVHFGLGSDPDRKSVV